MKRKAAKKGAGGRPTEYRAEFAEQARGLCVLGATDRELADFFHVDEVTIYRWRHAHPEFCKAIKIGKRSADDRVERALYARAIEGEVTAMIFWLKNRRAKAWRNFKSVELSTPPPGSGRRFEVRGDLFPGSHADLMEYYQQRVAAKEADRLEREGARPGERDAETEIEERLDALDPDGGDDEAPELPEL
jgi:hypothetical protein